MDFIEYVHSGAATHAVVGDPGKVGFEKRVKLPCEQLVVGFATLESRGPQQGNAVGDYVDADAVCFFVVERQVLGQCEESPPARIEPLIADGTWRVRGFLPDPRIRNLEFLGTPACCAVIVSQTRLSLHAGSWPL